MSTKTKTETNEAVQVKVLNSSGKEVGSVEIDPVVFGGSRPGRAGEAVRQSLVHQTVRWQRAKARSGTHQALTRTMKEGGAKKPFKQKGTGRARAGSSISPLWVGGASVHGPLPRSYEFRLSKRVRRQALGAVIADKAKSGLFVLVEDFGKVSGKTQDMISALRKIGVGDGVKATIVIGERNAAIERGARNIANVSVVAAEGASVYELMRGGMVITTKAGFEAMKARVQGTKISA